MDNKTRSRPSISSHLTRSGHAGPDLADGTCIETHRHPHGQLLYTTQGTLMVNTHQGCWVVPCNYGLWIPAEVAHWTRSLGATCIRTLYFAPQRTPGMPGECAVYAISNLVRELIIETSGMDRRLPKVAGMPAWSGCCSMNWRSPESRQSTCRAPGAAPSSAVPAPCPEQDAGLGLAECAGFLGLNIKTVQRWFHEDVGMSFGTWRKQARLLIALDRLAQGHNILDVSLDAGYSTPSAFTAMFKREFGQPRAPSSSHAAELARRRGSARRSIQHVGQHFIDQARGDRDQQQVGARLAPLIAVIVRQPANQAPIELLGDARRKRLAACQILPHARRQVCSRAPVAAIIVEDDPNAPMSICGPPRQSLPPPGF